MRIERYGETIWIDSEYRERDEVKKLPGARYSREAEKWHVPLSWAACVQARGVFGDRLEIGPDLWAWAQAELERRIVPCMALREADDGPVFDLPEGLELEPRQRAGVEFLRVARAALEADGMGAGKTIQLICALERLEDAYPVLVVAPNSMLGTWAEEFGKWAPTRSVGVVRGPASKRRAIIEAGHDVLVINYEALRAHTRLAGYGFIKLKDKEMEPKELNAIAFRTVVADEAHRAKSPQSQQTRALWWVSQDAEYRFALTGTPLANTPEDLWAVMRFVEPSEWPGKTAFVERYGLVQWNNWGGMNVVGIKGETRDELFKILDPRFIRRPTQVVIPNLLEKLPPQLRTIDLLPKQQKAYDQMREQLLAELDSGILMATNPLSRLTRLLQLASAYGEVDEEGRLTLAEPSSKLDALDEVVDELLSEGESVVVFAESRQLIELYGRRLAARKVPVPFGIVTGHVQPDVRDRHVADFQAGKVPVMLATMAAGGEGITLTAARHVVFIQRSYSLIRDRQSEDRVWRRGQDRAVQRIDLETRDTVETRVREALAAKGDILEQVVRDEATVRDWLAKR